MLCPKHNQFGCTSTSTSTSIVITDLQLCMLHGVQDYTARLASLQAKGDDYEIAAAQIGVEVYSALNAAVA